MLAGVAVAEACNVPVFRFALERWRADAYRVTIVRREPLTEAEQGALAELERQHDRSLANLTVRVVDATKVETPEDRALVEFLGDRSFPSMVVQYPEALRIEPPVWVAPFSSDNTARLLDSPSRKQLLDRLLEGETAVWLLLECGDKAKDDQAAALLDEQLKRLTGELKLPELTDLPDDNLFAKTPLKLSFSVLRVPRSEAEAPLAQMLLRCESDLLERADPMVFPVFGRGRALLPLIGAGITADNITNSASFLVGACSCEVKELNPGFDLLVAADWDMLLSVDGKPLPIVPTRSKIDSPPELVPIPAGGGSADVKAAEDSQPSAAKPVAKASASAKASATVSGGIRHWMILTGVCLVVFAAVLWFTWPS